MTCHAFDIEDAKKYGVDSAIILYNLRFWLAHNKANGTHINDGYIWTYNSARALAELFPYWSSNKIQKLTKKLENDGVIIIGNYNKIGYDKTKWYSLPEYCLQPNGLNPSADSLNGISQTAQPIPDINTHVITDKINTDISLVPKEDEYFIDELDEVKFTYCVDAMRVINHFVSEYGDKIYTGSLTESEWSECEYAMSSVGSFNSYQYISWWMRTRAKGFRKVPSLVNMLCDVNGISFEQFYEAVFMQEID